MENGIIIQTYNEHSIRNYSKKLNEELEKELQRYVTYCIIKNIDPKNIKYAIREYDLSFNPDNNTVVMKTGFGVALYMDNKTYKLSPENHLITLLGEDDE